MSETIAEISDSDFQNTIAKGVVLVDFWAPWCTPCRRQAPVLEDVAKRVPPGAKIAKINIDENSAAAQAQGVQSIPTLILFKDGKELKRFVGFTDADDLLSAISQASGNR